MVTRCRDAKHTNVLFKSPRDVLQINTINQQLGVGSQLKEWYQAATSVSYDHLLFDLLTDSTDFVYQQDQKQSFWTMSLQYVSILRIFQTSSQKLKNISSYQLSDCLQGELQRLRKIDVNSTDKSHEEETHCIKEKQFKARQKAYN